MTEPEVDQHCIDRLRQLQRRAGWLIPLALALAASLSSVATVLAVRASTSQIEALNEPTGKALHEPSWALTRQPFHAEKNS